MADTTSRLRDIRESTGISQGALAQIVGVSRQTINSIETGKFDPSLPLAIKLARHFNVSVEDLFWLAADEK